MLKDKRVLIVGGTGSLGKILVRRLLTGEIGKPAKIIVFSRDEAKQHEMRMAYKNRTYATDEIIYRNFEELLEFRIGDVRNFQSITSAMKNDDVVLNTAALKQVPVCEYFPYEAVMTNITGSYNIVQAIRNYNLNVDTVMGISTDKACKPVNVMGMTKAIQERIFIEANLHCPKARFICVRYGNVLASRGSVIPLFHDQIRSGGPITITTPEMTRFLLSLEKAVDVIFAAIREAKRGETYIPKVPAAKIVDIATVLTEGKNIKTVITGVRPGEKIHELLVSEEECSRTVDRGKYFVILPILPELRTSDKFQAIGHEISSADNLMKIAEVEQLLEREGLTEIPVNKRRGELLR